METVLLVVQILVAVAMVGVILLQRPAQDGGGLMGGSSTMGGLFTARGSANLLTRTTAFLATVFIVISLVLGYMAGGESRAKAELMKAAVQESVPTSSSEQAPPSVPVSK